MTSQSFQDLVVWQKAHKFVLNVYRFSSGFPKREIYSLTAQMRRAAISISANISEGFKKEGIRDKARFLNIAQGSLEEVRYYLILVNDLNYGNTGELRNQIDDVARMLYAYRNTIISKLK
ncbi:MAG: four helix bundle protein [Pyrinomonadaceae bacterium]|nr:four helix bundle protein [Pyrinomonadaceae bacterium]